MNGQQIHFVWSIFAVHKLCLQRMQKGAHKTLFNLTGRINSEEYLKEDLVILRSALFDIQYPLRFIEKHGKH